MRNAFLEALRSAGVVRPIDYHFARTIGTLANEDRDEVLVAAAMTSARLGEGHVCLPLSTLAGTQVAAESERRFPPLDSWLQALAESPMVSPGPGLAPLILTTNGQLYLRRYWLHEQSIAQSILSRAALESSNTGNANDALDQLFPGADDSDKQRSAAQLSCRRSFAVVSGGPGTGKTSTVVKILALLVEEALAAGQPPPRMTLLAPTGKAAARLVESIQGAKAKLPSRPAVVDAIADTASTIHRALGAIPGSSTRFRHHAGNPLVTDLVLVDEASMVNVALMSRLLAAVPDHAKVILLGDKDQLASVEAGSILGDICGSGASADSAAPAIASCVTHLTKSYRYREGSGIEALAQAINAGDAKAALDVLGSDAYPDVQRQPSLPAHRLGKALATQIGHGYKSFHDATDPKNALDALATFRVLCAHHEGPASVTAINEEVRRQLDGRGRSIPGEAHYPGQPIMIRVNDYDLKLFNGDVGAVLQSPDGLRAYFEGADGALRSVAPARLPAHVPVYAMSIHKSQGSEFSEVAIVLPRDVSPVLTRELLYTAVTRAKKQLCIYADSSVIRTCVETPTRRDSGLRDLLWTSQ